MSRRPILLDMDMGVDDALALVLALRSPEVEVRGITTVNGNVPVDQATTNTLVVLEILEAPPIPVVAGAAAPLARPPLRAAEVHGADGLGNLTPTLPVPARQAEHGAAAFLLETIRRDPEELTLVATGPLTNVAQAIRQDGGTMRRLRGLVVMGGAIRVPGNVGPVTEFNFAVDPEAAAIVLEAGLPLTLVPLDVTEQVVLTRRMVEDAASLGPRQAFVRDLTAATMDFHRDHEGEDGMFLHDPLAMASVLDPSLLRWEGLAVAVEQRGELTAGMAVADFRRRFRGTPTAEVGLGVDSARVLTLFSQRVLA